MLEPLFGARVNRYRLFNDIWTPLESRRLQIGDKNRVEQRGREFVVTFCRSRHPRIVGGGNQRVSDGCRLTTRTPGGDKCQKNFWKQRPN